MSWWDARPDQRPPSAPPGLGAGFRGGTFRGRLVIVGGAGGGEFVYNATFTVLQSSNCGAATHDPILGRACPQGFATYNAFGAVINLLSTSKSAFFQYFDNGSAVQGALILAVASTSSNDPVVGTHYPAGLYGVDPVFGDNITTLGAAINLNQVAYTRGADVLARTPADSAHQPFLLVDAPEETTASHLQMLLAGASPDGTTKLAQLAISAEAGSAIYAPVTNTLLELAGSMALTGSANAIVGGVQEVWKTLGTLAGYTVTVGLYRLTALGDLELDIVVIAGGANAASTTFSVTLPAAYRPANQKEIPAATSTNIAAGVTQPRVVIATTGTVTVQLAANSASTLYMSGPVPLN